MLYTTLNNGLKMPMLGFGVYQVPDPAVCEKAVSEAISAGYRLIDTAAAYMNEEAVGRAVKKSGVKREDLFITTKLWVQDASYEKAKDAIETSGVSNFYPHILTDFCETVDIIPAVNQVELHPFFAQENALKTMKEYGVTPEAWGPFAEGKHGIFTHPVLTEIAKKYGKSTAQVALRWNIQRGVVVIPKSTHENRIKENIDVFDFELSPEDMAKINALSLDRSEIVDHTNPAFIKMIHSLKIHD